MLHCAMINASRVAGIGATDDSEGVSKAWAGLGLSSFERRDARVDRGCLDEGSGGLERGAFADQKASRRAGFQQERVQNQLKFA